MLSCSEYTRLVGSARPQNVVSSMPNIHREERGIPSPTLAQLPPALELTLGLFTLRDLEINGIWQAAGWLCVSNQTLSVSPTLTMGIIPECFFGGGSSHLTPRSSLVDTSGLVNFSLTFLLDSSTKWCVWFSSVVWCVCVCVYFLFVPECLHCWY